MVKEFTKEIIAETVKVYAEDDDGYWLKSHHFAGEIDITVFDQLQAKDIEENKEILQLSGIDEDKFNKSEQGLFQWLDINNS